MPQEQDYAVITIEDDDDDDIVIIEDSESEDNDNRFSTGDISTIQPNSQGSSGVQGLAVLGRQAVSQMNRPANLKRNRSNSKKVKSIPLCKKRRSTTLREETMALKKLIKGTNRQVNQLCGIVSKMQRALEKHHGNCSSSLPVKRQRNCSQANRAGTSLRSAASPEPEQPVLREEEDAILRESSPLPKIISTHSLQPCFTPGSQFPGLAVLSYFFKEDVESVINVSPDQANLAVRTEILPQGEYRVENNPVMMNYLNSLEDKIMIPDSTSSSVCIPPNFEMLGEVGTSLETNSETRNYATSLGNDSVPKTVSSSLSIHPSIEMPGKEDTNLETNYMPMNPRALLGNDNGPDTVSSLSIPPNFAEFEILHITEMPGKADTSLETSPVSMTLGALLGNESGSDTASSSLSIPPNFDEFKMIHITELLGEEGTSLETGCEAMSSLALLGNQNGPESASSSFSIPPNFEMLDKVENSLEEHPEEISYLPLLGSGNGQDLSSSAFCVLPSSEMLVRAQTSLESSPAGNNDPFLLGNGSGQDPLSSSLYILPSFEASLETSSKRVDYPVLLENDSDPNTTLPPLFLTSSFGYLGDPKRNVKILNTHLAIAQKKAIPKHAACYLVRILFSEEILICSSVGVNSQGRQPLDPNKMAAIREYLATIFPNHDLSENGKDWKICISDISSLICYLCSEAKGDQQKTVDRNTDPVNPDIPASADPNDKRDSGAGSSLVPQQMAALEARENGGSQQNGNATTGGLRETSTNNSVIRREVLEYFGNPCRNIQLPYSIIDKAKEKPCPELSARYLIRNLFTDEVLIKSNVYGSRGRGMCALNSNRINALREFLQDVYPSCDLSETGYAWKLCVAAINSSIRTLRYYLKKAAAKVQPLPATTSSNTESEPTEANN
ncbi:BEN domain-containing protein 2 isoform X2 [Tamandua tetradactyla]|uniref:BEN domain-containing protein 2 isoform X2 n=1 Tax=Tamandua tetradactyla TaxID=48850 RepID=UPI004053B7EF